MPIAGSGCRTRHYSNSCHLADVLLAMRCGKPVLCEKPMGMNSGECRQMVEAARMPGYCWEWRRFFALKKAQRD